MQTPEIQNPPKIAGYALANNTRWTHSMSHNEDFIENCLLPKYEKEIAATSVSEWVNQ